MVKNQQLLTDFNPIASKILRFVFMTALLIFPLVAAWLGINAVFDFWRSLDFQEYARLAYWGGNIAEQLSHLLDLFLMSGSAAALAYCLVVERAARGSEAARWRLASRICAGLTVSLIAVRCLSLDWQHGENTTLIVWPLLFAPTLGGSYLLLRIYAARQTSLGRVAAAALLFSAAHLGLQLIYEPSETGGPNGWFMLIWPWFALSPVGLWMIGRYKTYNFASDDGQMKLLHTLKRAVPCNILLVVFMSITTVLAWQVIENSTSVLFSWRKMPALFVAEWALFSAFGLYVAIRAATPAGGAIHAVLVLSGALLVSALLLTVIGRSLTVAVLICSLAALSDQYRDRKGAFMGCSSRLTGLVLVVSKVPAEPRGQFFFCHTALGDGENCQYAVCIGD